VKVKNKNDKNESKAILDHGNEELNFHPKMQA
jgi:hypothetical protein